MKKLFLSLAALLFVAVSANAQEAEQWWIGGGIGFNTESPDVGGSQTDFIIKPEVGYQISDRWGVGMSIGFSSSEIGEGGDRKSNFIINPFVRYSFLKGGIGNLFLEGGVEYAHSQFRDADNKENSIGINIKPGVNVNISENLSFIGKFGLLGWTHETESKLNRFGLSVDATNVQLGLVFKF